MKQERTLVKISLSVKIRLKDKIALTVPSSGIAAGLLPVGGVGHNRFKTSLKVTGDLSTECEAVTAV
jgi:hypothetical protein